MKNLKLLFIWQVGFYKFEKLKKICYNKDVNKKNNFKKEKGYVLCLTHQIQQR